MVLKIAIFQKNDRNLIGKIMHCAIENLQEVAQFEVFVTENSTSGWFLLIPQSFLRIEKLLFHIIQD